MRCRPTRSCDLLRDPTPRPEVDKQKIGKDTLPAATSESLEGLSAETVYLLGGTGAVLVYRPSVATVIKGLREHRNRLLRHRPPGRRGAPFRELKQSVDEGIRGHHGDDFQQHH